jgi:hypothetical protein
MMEWTLPDAWTPWGLLFWIVLIVLVALLVSSKWIVFVKAGRPGWQAFIPVYELLVRLRLVERPSWWLLPQVLLYGGELARTTLVLLGLIQSIAAVVVVLLIIFILALATMGIGILVDIEFARRFGKSTAFGIGLWLLPFVCYPILAFGSAVFSDCSGDTEPQAA